MAFRTEACITIACDLCGYVLGEADDGPQHYTTEAAALELALAQGWHRLADGRVVCEDDGHAAALVADAVARFEAASSA
ncbi:hypothetical protein [Kitasatospora sp. GP82]|uniref:hypothetical protein n=1 Tax=Kitasatospora sp. GP82 TaxID=3035089 RepID=UPI002476814B|nr:hypothetical protein [Kitasatospora sp. GP82]MDH6125936.1 hypothetical protein [Kitasatospora sp. GP82]